MFTIAAIRHQGSEITQSVQLLRGAFFFHSRGPESWGLEETRREITEAEARDTLLVWRDLASDGEARVIHEDELLMEVHFGARHLEMLVGEAPEQQEPDEGPEVFAMENASPAAPWDPEAQEDLELHNALHPQGYSE